jgi:SLIT-ROBO Rho GTPase activating protein
LQLAEQLKQLDVRVETHVSMLQELQDFYRRRAEVEQEYSIKLDKLVKNVITRHKQERQRSVCKSRLKVLISQRVLNVYFVAVPWI